jgi:hypothetical protein
MRDVTLCTGKDCPLKEDCYRWDGNTPCTPDCEGQSYFIRPPWTGEGCDNFVPMKEKDDGC